METNAKVKLRGVQVGRVAAIEGGSEPVALKFEIYPDQIEHIPANVEAQIRATTVFGAKFVDLVYPSDPSPQRLKAGQVLRSRNVSVEVNTVFENVVGVLEQDRPGQAQQRAVGARRRRPRKGRADRSGHHRRQSGSAGAQPAQRNVNAPTGARCGTSTTPTALRRRTF